MLKANPQPAVLPADHPEIKTGKVGVLLINLGTPEGTDYWSMRRYLKEFLSDPRVIEAPRALWWLILNGIILQTRPSRSGRAYASIWNKELDESPLKTFSRGQAQELAKRFADRKELRVEWAMRYGLPTIAEKIEALKAQGCDRILLTGLYPHYSAATTATAYDKAFDHLKTMRWQPAVRTLPSYHDHPAFIEAIADSMTAHLEGLDWQPDVILTSYHGLPQSYLAKGDPYHCQCHKTTRLLRSRLGCDDDYLMVTFQSRFGPEEWLQPYTDKTVAALARQGVKRLAIVAPGFSADCLETLEELAEENREIFIENGGEHFSYIPCLNDSDAGMKLIETLVLEELAGWLD